MRHLPTQLPEYAWQGPTTDPETMLNLTAGAESRRRLADRAGRRAATEADEAGRWGSPPRIARWHSLGGSCASPAFSRRRRAGLGAVGLPRTPRRAHRAEA